MTKIIEVKVFPGAKKNLLKEEGGLLKIYLKAPPVEGKANDALIKFLAESWKIKKREIQIIKGLKSRIKTISINGI